MVEESSGKTVRDEVKTLWEHLCGLEPQRPPGSESNCNSMKINWRGTSGLLSSLLIRAMSAEMDGLLGDRDTSRHF